MSHAYQLVADAILNDVGTAKKKLTHAYVVPSMCHGMLRCDVEVTAPLGEFCRGSLIFHDPFQIG